MSTRDQAPTATLTGTLARETSPGPSLPSSDRGSLLDDLRGTTLVAHQNQNQKVDVDTIKVPSFLKNDGTPDTSAVPRTTGPLNHAGTINVINQLIKDHGPGASVELDVNGKKTTFTLPDKAIKMPISEADAKKLFGDKGYNALNGLQVIVEQKSDGKKVESSTIELGNGTSMSVTPKPQQKQ